jgi:hypothetical protein
MKSVHFFGFLLALIPTLCFAETTFDPAARASFWSGDRRSSEEAFQPNAELWLRSKATISPEVTLKFEAWMAANATGAAQAGADVRDGYVQIDTGPVLVRAGRQTWSWGRGDRINPTDIASARDYRRLVEEDEDNRQGLAGISVETDLAAGKLSVHWIPEFRPTRLPQNLEQPGLAVIETSPKDKLSQMALRYERFGHAIDWSITVAQMADRLPWLSLQPAVGGGQIQLQHPRVRMIGGDVATVAGKYGIRLEAAGYFYSQNAYALDANRVPTFAVVAGIDRSFPRQWSIIVQSVLRLSRSIAPTANVISSIKSRNDTIHGAWDGAIGGGFIRLRKGFSGDRGAAEVTAASLTGGGSYGQAKASYTFVDGVKIVAMAEHHAGSANSYFGRLRSNNLVMVGLRAGF